MYPEKALEKCQNVTNNPGNYSQPQPKVTFNAYIKSSEPQQKIGLPHLLQMVRCLSKDSVAKKPLLNSAVMQKESYEKKTESKRKTYNPLMKINVKTSFQPHCGWVSSFHVRWLRPSHERPRAGDLSVESHVTPQTRSAPTFPSYSQMLFDPCLASGSLPCFRTRLPLRNCLDIMYSNGHYLCFWRSTVLGSSCHYLLWLMNFF